MNEVLVPLLAFVATTSLGGAVLTARLARRQSLRARISGWGTDESVLVAPGPRSALRHALRRLAELLAFGRPSEQLINQLASAGYYGKHAGTAYLGAKVLLFLSGLTGLGAALLTVDASLTVVGVASATGAAVLSCLPNVVLHVRRSKRSEEIRMHLPDALDLLEICVSSGMGLDMAWNAVADEVRSVSATLADEVALTNLELHLGAPRAAAMRRMAQRTGAQEIASLVAVLVQSERFGTSISDALRTFASSMREMRSQRAAEAAEKTTVKLLFPMILLIFPAILVVAVGPAGITLTEVLGWQ